MPGIQTTLTLTAKDFTSPAEGARLEMARLTQEINLGKANLALWDKEARSAGGGSDALTAKIKTQRAELEGLSKAYKTVKTEAAIFTAASAGLQPMPTASRPQATITRGHTTDGQEGGEGHGGGNAMRNAELMHSGRAMADMISAGMSPIQAFMAEAPRLFQSFAGTLGSLLLPIAALVGGGAFVKWLHDADTEAKALRVETAGIASNLGSLAGANADALDKSLAAAAAQVRKVREANDSKGNFFVNHLTGRGVHDSDVQAAMEQQQRIQDRMQDAQGRDQGFAQRSFDGDAGVEADKIRLEYAQKRDEIVKKASADDLTNSTRALSLAQQDRDLKLEVLARTQQSRENELAMETQIISVRKYGLNVESEIARVRLEAAQADLKNAPAQGPEHDAAQNKVWSAQNDSDDAKRRDKDRLDALDLKTRNANLRGSKDDVSYQRATNERDAIQGKIDDPGVKPDERKKLEADLAEAKERIHDLVLASHQKGFDVEKKDIESGTGRGPQEQIRAIDEQLALIERRRKENAESNDDDALANAQLKDDAAGLLRQKQEILFTEKESLDTLKAQVAAIQNQGFELTAVQKKAAIAAKFQKDIDKANRNNDPEAAAEYGRQRDAEQTNIDVDEAMMTPKQRQARERHNRRRQQALDHVQHPGTRDADRDGSAIHNADGPGGSMIPEAGTGHGAVESRENASSFDDFFNGDRHMPALGHMPAPGHMPDRRVGGDVGGPNANAGNEKLVTHLAKIEAATSIMAKNLDLGPGSKWFQPFNV